MTTKIEELADVSICNQVGCGKPSAYRYTWPGKDEAGICADCAPMVRNISAAMCCHIQLIPLPVEELEAAKGKP